MKISTVLTGPRVPVPPFNFLCLVLVAIVSAYQATAQEFPASAIPTRPLSDKVLYGAFLRNVAVFERKALEEEAKGNSGGEYRRFLIQRFGLTEQEHAQIAVVATNYFDIWLSLKAQLKDATLRFTNTVFPGNRYPDGTVNPPLFSPEMIALDKEIHTLTLTKRDEIHGRLGEARFQHLDTMLRARAAHDFEKLSVLKKGQK